MYTHILIIKAFGNLYQFMKDSERLKVHKSACAQLICLQMRI